jgi:hypothetical protein
LTTIGLGVVQEAALFIERRLALSMSDINSGARREVFE